MNFTIEIHFTFLFHIFTPGEIRTFVCINTYTQIDLSTFNTLGVVGSTRTTLWEYLGVKILTGVPKMGRMGGGLVVAFNFPTQKLLLV